MNLAASARGLSNSTIIVVATTPISFIGHLLSHEYVSETVTISVFLVAESYDFENANMAY